MNHKQFQSYVKNFDSRLLIIPFLILLILIMSFTLLVDYAFSQIRIYCNNLILELSSGDFSILDEEDGDIAVIACSILTQQNTLSVSKD